LQYVILTTECMPWFLFTLLMCKFCVSPLFHICGLLGNRVSCLTKGLVWVAVFVSTYALNHTWPWPNLNHRLNTLLMYALYYAQFFATGLLLTPSHWYQLFSMRITRLLCFAYWIIFYFFMDSDKDHGNSVYCYNGDCWDGHVPNMCYMWPMSWGGFVLELETSLLRNGIVLSYFGILSTFTSIVEACAPTAVRTMAEWGSRTLYSYTLSAVLGRAVVDSGFPLVFFENHYSTSTQYAIAFSFGTIMNICLCSRLTEFLFRWIIVPFWAKSWTENVVMWVWSRNSPPPEHTPSEVK